MFAGPVQTAKPTTDPYSEYNLPTTRNSSAHLDISHPYTERILCFILKVKVIGPIIIVVVLQPITIVLGPMEFSHRS